MRLFGVGAPQRNPFDLNDSEQQDIFNQFIRLEDRFGLNNEAHEVTVAENNGLTPTCVRDIMLMSLENGRVPPDPS